MIRADVPTIVGSTATTTAYNMDCSTGWVGAASWDTDTACVSAVDRYAVAARAARAVVNQFNTTRETRVQRRIVKVIIMDPNPNVPLDDCVLYRGEEQLTDLTDQELFFEIDIKTLLASHNEKRVKMVDKTVKDRVEYLEPARVSGLKMLVVNVATF